MADSEYWYLSPWQDRRCIVAMNTSLTLLGTAGGPTPQGHRHAPANVVVVNGSAYVFDCGNGVADQLVRAGIPFSALRAVFVTHNHSDHNADLGNLLLLGWSGITRPVEVYGPAPIASPMKYFFEMQRYDIDIRVRDEGRRPLDELVDVTEIDSAGVVYRDENVTVTSTLVVHPPVEPAFGYRIDSADRSIVFSGDTRPCDSLVELARGADVLVHEALYEPALGGLLSRHNGSRIREHLLASHTHAHEAGDVARRAGVQTLVLNHLVPCDGTVDDETWRSEAARNFDGDIVVAHDLMQLS